MPVLRQICKTPKLSLIIATKKATSAVSCKGVLNRHLTRLFFNNVGKHAYSHHFFFEQFKYIYSSDIHKYDYKLSENF